MRAHAYKCGMVWLPGVRLFVEMAAKDPSRPNHSRARLITHASVTDRIDRDLQQQHGLSFSAVEILCRLYDEEPQSLRSLANQLVSVSSTRASRLVQELVDAGHLQRGADQADGRKSLISFTPAGRRYTEKVARTLEDAVPPYSASTRQAVQAVVNEATDELAHLDDDQPRRDSRRLAPADPVHRASSDRVQSRKSSKAAGNSWWRSFIDRILASRSVGQIADHLPSGAPPSLPSESSPAVPRVPSIARKA